jgi:hypothetical protein
MLTAPKSLYYTDNDLNILEHDESESLPKRPKGATVQVAQFPCCLHQSFLKLNGDGSSTKLAEGSIGWPQDLVLAMVNKDDYSLSDAILIAAHLCEGCMNVMADKYGIEWGYAYGSDEHKRCGTSCAFCQEVELETR